MPPKSSSMAERKKAAKKKTNRQRSIGRLMTAREITGRPEFGKYAGGHLMAKKALMETSEEAKREALIAGRTLNPASRATHSKLVKQMANLRHAIENPGRYFWEGGNPVHHPRPPPAGGGGALLSAS